MLHLRPRGQPRRAGGGAGASTSPARTPASGRSPSAPGSTTASAPTSPAPSSARRSPTSPRGCRGSSSPASPATTRSTASTGSPSCPCAGALSGPALRRRYEPREVAERRARRGSSKRRPAASPRRSSAPGEVKCGSPNSSPTTSRPPGLQHAGDLAQRRVLVGDLAEHGGQHDGVDRVVLVGKRRRRRPASASTFASPRSAARAHRVVEHLLLDVEDLDRPAGADPLGQVERVVAGAGADLEHALAGRGREHRAQAVAGDQRVRRLDPEALAVGARRGVLAPPERGGEDRRGAQRAAASASGSPRSRSRGAASSTRTKTTVARLSATVAVLGLRGRTSRRRRSTALRRSARARSSASRTRQHLADRRTRSRPRFSSSAISCSCSQCSPPARRSRSARRRSTLGCRKATRLPRIPMRGLGVDQLDARARAALASAASMSSTR